MSKVKTIRTSEFGGSRTTGVIKLIFDENGLSQELDNDVAEKLADISGSLDLVPGEFPDEKEINKVANPGGEAGDVTEKETGKKKDKELEKVEGKKKETGKKEEVPATGKKENTPASTDDEKVNATITETLSDDEKELIALGDDGIKELLAGAKIDAKIYKDLSGAELVKFAMSKLN